MKKIDYPLIACHVIVGLPCDAKAKVESDVLGRLEDAVPAFVSEEWMLESVFCGKRTIATRKQVASFIKMMLIDCMTHKATAVVSGLFRSAEEREGLTSIINGYRELAVCHYVGYKGESQIEIAPPTEEEGWDRIIAY